MRKGRREPPLFCLWKQKKSAANLVRSRPSIEFMHYKGSVFSLICKIIYFFCNISPSPSNSQRASISGYVSRIVRTGAMPSPSPRRSLARYGADHPICRANSLRLPAVLYSMSAISRLFIYSNSVISLISASVNSLFN